MDIKDKLKAFIDNSLNDTFVSFKKAKMMVDRTSCVSNATFEDWEDRCFESDINSFITDNKNDNKFQKLLFQYIDERNLKDSDVYNKVHIDRRLFSKIRSDSDYHPSKETVILLGLALELSEEEFISLLDSASYSLPKNNYYDLVIRFCFMEGIYRINEVNELLNSYGCKLFSY